MPTPAHRSPRRSVRRLPWVLASVLVVALATPVVAGVVGPVDRPERAPVATDDSTVSSAPEDASAAPTPVRRPLRIVPAATIEKAPEPKPEPKPEPAAEELRNKAERRARKPERPEPPVGPMSFRIGTFNVLGSQHTAPGEGNDRYPPASVRTAGAAGLVAKHGVDILGTQELQADQLRGLQSRTGMAAYPGFAWGEAETDNSVLYDPGVFELVSGSRFTITFMGRPRPQPIVRLRHLATGREFYVVNVHVSAGEGRYATERRNGYATLVGVVNDLKAQGLPVLVTGDMNDREEFYCQVVPPAGLTAPNGGSYGSGCQPPPPPVSVDWVVGSGASWSNYWRDTSPADRRISNHQFISALATVS